MWFLAGMENQKKMGKYTGQTPNIPSLLCRNALAHLMHGSLSGGTATTTAFLPTGDLVSLCEVIEI